MHDNLPLYTQMANACQPSSLSILLSYISHYDHFRFNNLREGELLMSLYAASVYTLEIYFFLHISPDDFVCVDVFSPGA